MDRKCLPFFCLLLFLFTFFNPVPTSGYPVDAWFPRTSGTTAMLWSVTYGNGLFVAAGRDGQILTSADGITWTKRVSSTGEWLYNVTYGNNMFVAVGGHGVICTSSDGITWVVRASGTTEWLDGVAWSGGTFAAVGNNGAVVTSQTGLTWSRRASGTTRSLHGVVYGNGQFVAAGDGEVLTSADGVTWMRRNPNSPLWFNGIAYGNGIYVMVAGNGTILTSTDGIVWAKRNSTTTQEIYGVCYGGGTFVAAGNGGTILASFDGTEWSAKNSGTSRLLYGAAYGGGSYVITGDAGTVLQSGTAVQVPPPVADAGPDQRVMPGSYVSLDGYRSTGTTPLFYAWHLTSRPLDSSAAITNQNSMNTGFRADRAGTYEARLSVTDPWGNVSRADLAMIVAPFLDVSPGSWPEPYINAVSAAHLTSGYGGTNEFKPDYEVQRDQMAAFLVRAREGEPDDGYCNSGSHFTDVSPADWACKYIERLYDLGLTSGYGGTTLYKPDLPITREQMAVFIVRAREGDSAASCQSAPYSDVPVSSWSCPYIKRLTDLGITTGYGGTDRFRPELPVTRAQMAAFIARAFLGIK